MSEGNTLNSDTKPPYEQFESCDNKTCVYRNVLSERCLFETCMFDYEFPVHATEWEFECMVCHKPEIRSPRDMKIHICDSCLERIRATEELPFSCVFCGSSQNKPSKIPLSGICDTCFKKINNAINCKRCGN